jgi:hypothetical protein
VRGATQQEHSGPFAIGGRTSQKFITRPSEKALSGLWSVSFGSAPLQNGASMPHSSSSQGLRLGSREYPDSLLTEFYELRLPGKMLFARSSSARFTTSKQRVGLYLRMYRHAQLPAKTVVKRTRRKRQSAQKARQELGPPRRSPQAQAGSAQAP